MTKQGRGFESMTINTSGDSYCKSLEIRVSKNPRPRSKFKIALQPDTQITTIVISVDKCLRNGIAGKARQLTIDSNCKSILAHPKTARYSSHLSIRRSRRKPR